MIENRWRKGAGYVTDTAILSRRNMAGMLADRRNTVTRSTIVHDAAVIKDCVGKTGGGVMAHPAVCGSGYMIRRQSYGPRPIMSSIMARDTIAGDTHVSKDRWREPGGRMANVTILSRRHMVCSFNKTRIGGKESADMATLATAGNVLMKRSKKRCRAKKISGIVTDAAITLCRNVINRFGRCDITVMT